MKVLSLIPLLFAFVSASPVEVETSVLEKRACAGSGYYFVFARGTGDIPGPGILGMPVGAALQAKIPDLTIYGVNYPASTDFGVSANQGKDDMIKYMQDTVAACPTAKFYIGGYSQGGIVVHFVADAIDDALKSHIKAAVTFGDPIKQGDAGTPNYLTFCAAGDIICNGQGNIFAHFSYSFDGSIQKAADYLAQFR